MNKIYVKGATLCLLFLLGLKAQATIYPINNSYSGPPTTPSTARGTIVGTYNDETNVISYSIIFFGLTTGTTVAHFHGPATATQTAGVQIAHAGFPAGVTAGMYTATNTLSETQEAQLKSGLWYSNIHTTTYPGGEIRAQIMLGDPATTSPFRNTYSGAQEVPPTPSTATGMIIGTYNHQTNAISYSIYFTGLTTGSTAAHFHGPATATQFAGVQIAHAGFPTGVTTGFYTATNTLSDAQETQLLSNLWYSNIHSTTNTGGEIRANLRLQDILPPVISAVTVNPASLWPANHKMRNVSVSYTSTDNFPAATTCILTVTSDEPVTSEDDETSPDWLVSNSMAAQLRAERSGSGDGRTYTLTVTCTDAQGNSASRTATVLVPHDNGHITRISGVEEEGTGNLDLRVLSNPAKNYFTLGIRSGGNDKVQVQLFDVTGRLVEARANVSGNANIQVGSGLRAGIYLLKVQQGRSIRQLQLVKTD